jgi:arylsulfatase A-like enzyme
MGLLGRAASITVRVGGLFALVDVWQVALFAPGSLEPWTLAWLLALWAGTTFGAALVLLVVVERRWHTAVVARVTAALVGVGAWLLSQEVGLRALQPLSPWRPAVVVATLGVGAVAGLVTLRLSRTRWRWAVPVGALVLAFGMVGAVRGFAIPHAANDENARAPATGAPNVLIVLIDTLRADHLGCYGYGRPTSPAIDRLATQGTLFLHATSQSTWTKPSTASLFTGRYPSQHQAYLERSRIPDAELLLPEALAQLGYRTAVFSGNPWVTPEYGFAQGVEHFDSIYDERFARVTLYMQTLKRINMLLSDKRRVYNFVKSRVQHTPSTTARDQVLLGHLIHWLDDVGNHPFFAHVQLMSPHHPYDPPPPFDRFVPKSGLAPVTTYPHKSYFFFDQGAPLAPAALADMVGRYDGDILFADGVVERILAALDARGLAENTVVVLTSDHGEEFYDHQNWGHGQSVYEELAHVPLIIRYPKAFPAGQRVERPVMLVDVMPTILALAGAAPIPSLAGQSLLGGAPGATGRDEAYVELIYRYGWARALRRGSRKIIRMVRGEDDRTAVYDLDRDPGEQHPLATPAPDLADRMAAIQAWSSAHQSAPAAEVEIDSDMSRRLKALGYLQ